MFLVSLALGLFLLILLIGDIIAGIRVGLLVPIGGRLWGWIVLLDPGDASGDAYGGLYLVLGMASGFVDEGGSDGRVSSE